MIQGTMMMRLCAELTAIFKATTFRNAQLRTLNRESFISVAPLAGRTGQRHQGMVAGRREDLCAAQRTGRTLKSLGADRLRARAAALVRVTSLWSRPTMMLRS